MKLLMRYIHKDTKLILKDPPTLQFANNRDYLQIEVLGGLLGLALYPYVYTALRVSFSLIGSSYIDVSKNLGLSDVKMFFKVVLPLSKPV